MQKDAKRQGSEYPTLPFASPKHCNAAFHQGCSSHSSQYRIHLWTRAFPWKGQVCICIHQNRRVIWKQVSFFVDNCFYTELSLFYLPSKKKGKKKNPSAISYTSNCRTSIISGCLFVVGWPWLTTRFPASHSYHSPFSAEQGEKKWWKAHGLR